MVHADNAASMADELQESTGMIPVRHIDMKTAAEILRVDLKKLYRRLKIESVFFSEGELKNTPKVEYIERGFFTTVLSHFRTGPVNHMRTAAVVTPTGLAYLQEFIAEHDLDSNEPLAPAEQSGVSHQQKPGDGRSEVLSMAKKL